MQIIIIIIIIICQYLSNNHNYCTLFFEIIPVIYKQITN